MKRTIATIALLAVIGSSCSSGLSEAETVWCSRNRDVVVETGLSLRLDEGPKDDRMVYLEDDDFWGFVGEAYDRACRAAYKE